MPAPRTSGSPPDRSSPQSLDALDEDCCLDCIPSSQELRAEIDKYVTEPQTVQARRLAAWCVREYRSFIKLHNTGNAVFKYDRSVSSEIVQKAQLILLKKGWSLIQNGVECFCLSPCTSDWRPSRIV
jgi:hypothetical protein